MTGQGKNLKIKINHPAKKSGNYGQKNRSGFHPSRCGCLRAQELVEFALIFPVLVFLLIGVIDMGRAFYALIQISNAAREGARYGITYAIEDNCPTPRDGIYETINNDAISDIVKGEVGNFLDGENIEVVSGCLCSEPDPDPDPSNDLCLPPSSDPDCEDYDDEPCISEARLRVVVKYTLDTILFPPGSMQLVRDMEMMIP